MELQERAQDQSQEKLQPSEDEAEVVPDCGEDGVGSGTVQRISRELVT